MLTNTCSLRTYLIWTPAMVVPNKYIVFILFLIHLWFWCKNVRVLLNTHKHQPNKFHNILKLPYWCHYNTGWSQSDYLTKSWLILFSCYNVHVTCIITFNSISSYNCTTMPTFHIPLYLNCWCVLHSARQRRINNRTSPCNNNLWPCT